MTSDMKRPVAGAGSRLYMRALTAGALSAAVIAGCVGPRTKRPAGPATEGEEAEAAGKPEVETKVPAAEKQVPAQTPVKARAEPPAPTPPSGSAEEVPAGPRRPKQGEVPTGPREVAFNSREELSGWEVAGDVKIDTTRKREGAGALRVGPGGKAVWRLRERNGSGTVDFWIYEEMTLPADPKKRRVGPRWGLLQEDGKIFAVGMMYAPFLAGQRTYATTDWSGESWFSVQYLGECRRKKGWHRWTFEMDPEKGLTISFDGKDVNARRKRFDWNRTALAGFAGVVFLGDTGQADPHTIFVGDLSVTLGGPMKVKPAPPPPPPPATPEKDPAPEKPVELLEAVRGRHPRLLFSAEDIPAMKRFARNEGKEFFDGLEEYLGPSKPPAHTKFLRDATDAQRQGLWRTPTVALHYVLTGDKKSFEKALGFMKEFLALEHWEEGRERDSGMGAANIMIGAALAYDWLHNDLEPGFREAFGQKLLLQARRMYHRGHLNKGKSVGYWQADPQNNHRWHRDAGLALAALAVAGERPEDDWILAKTYEELAFVARWLPPDGTSHESASYLVFGGTHLTLAMQASDRCFGTRHLKLPFFRNVGMFRLQSLTPGLKGAFHFGDSGGLGGYNNFLFKCASEHQLKDVQAGLVEMSRLNPAAYWLHWLSLVWYDPSLQGGSVGKLPKTAFFPDLGLAYVRDGWEKEDVGVMFKCGPYGGFKLNEYRNARDFHYVNVAHDDPDANSFLVFAGGELLAETSRYSKKKLTSSHNTILVGGRGQRGEGGGWTQPFKRGDKDMTKSAYVTTWKDAGEVVVVEGEAGGAYPDLERFRRTFLFVKSDYVLVLDDIRAEKGVEVTWLVQAPRLDAVEGNRHRYRLRRGQVARGFTVVSDGEMSAEISESTADHRGKPLGWQQLRLSRKTAAWRLASVYDAWDHGGIEVEMTPAAEAVPPGGRGAPERAETTVLVRGPGFEDAWRCLPARDSRTPSVLTGRRKGGFTVVVDEKDRAGRE